MTYGLKGWMWFTPSGRLGVIYGDDEKRVFVDAEHERQIARFLQVDLGLQDELREFHDSKYSRTPKTAPLSPRRYTGKIEEILPAATPACA